ncbi:MAG: response regulator [Leptospiraceae bacterium]|nr:response regulator [Leptospiraceae bacterium]
MKKILIVDDQPQISKILNDILIKSGYTTEMAFDGLVGVQKAKQIKPDIIIMDVMMPVMSGFEACKQIKADSSTSKIPIVFLTAKGQEDDEEEAIKLGATAFITKPFSPKSVLALIEKIIGK